MIDFQLEDILSGLLEKMALEGKRHFSPHYVCTLSGIADIVLVSEYLFQQVSRKRLKVFFEVECPEGDSDFAIKSPDEIPRTKRKCHICGTEYVPNPEKIWVAFSFEQAYLDYLKKKTIKEFKN